MFFECCQNVETEAASRSRYRQLSFQDDIIP